MNDAKYITQPINGGNVSISEDVISTIAIEALSKIESASVAGAAKKSAKPVKVKVADGKVTLDVAVNVRYGQAVTETAKKVQKEIAEAVSSMTGLEIAAVNVTVSGITPNVDH
jgi:uncharacterized alkaline shock family protein YloU